MGLAQKAVVSRPDRVQAPTVPSPGLPGPSRAWVVGVDRAQRYRLFAGAGRTVGHTTRLSLPGRGIRIPCVQTGQGLQPQT